MMATEWLPATGLDTGYLESVFIVPKNESGGIQIQLPPSIIFNAAADLEATQREMRRSEKDLSIN
jgi:hypothetical protein